MNIKKQRKNIWIGLGFLALIVLSFSIVNAFNSDDGLATNSNQENKEKAIVYKSSTCGCCVKYIAYLKNEDYDVEVVETDNMNLIKKQYQIPRDMESCHTTVFPDKNKVAEGHVPVETLEMLLASSSGVNKIALPNMPAGSPGMPGIKTGPFVIYEIEESGEVSVFNEI